MSKKVISLVLSLLSILMLFSACSKAPAKWSENLGENEYFKDLPAYSTGDIISANFDSSCNVKIEDNDYTHFEKYIKTLKGHGFKFLPFGTEPENYSLNDQGQASWRATDGNIYLMIIFNETGTEGFTSFGDSNIIIYGYSEKPAGWTLSDNK